MDARSEDEEKQFIAFSSAPAGNKPKSEAVEDQAVEIWNRIEASLANGESVGILYSANQDQAEQIYQDYAKNSISPISGSGQAELFNAIAKKIEANGVQDRVHILPIPTSKHGGAAKTRLLQSNVVTKAEIDLSLQNVENHLAGGWKVMGLERPSTEEKSLPTFAIGGGVTGWLKTEKIKLENNEKISQEDYLQTRLGGLYQQANSPQKEFQSTVANVSFHNPMKEKKMGFFSRRVTSSAKKTTASLDFTSLNNVNEMKTKIESAMENYKRNARKITSLTSGRAGIKRADQFLADIKNMEDPSLILNRLNQFLQKSGNHAHSPWYYIRQDFFADNKQLTAQDVKQAIQEASKQSSFSISQKEEYSKGLK